MSKKILFIVFCLFLYNSPSAWAACDGELSSTTSNTSCDSGDSATINSDVTLNRNADHTINTADNVTITNYGEILSNYNEGVNSDDDNVTINNKSTGFIRTKKSRAIWLNGVGDYDITNEGEIKAWTYCAICTNTGHTGDITINNSGTIHTAATNWSTGVEIFKSAIGIRSPGSGGTFTLINSGTIKSIDDNLAGVYVDDDVNATITNSGTIQGDGSRRAIHIQDTGTETGTTIKLSGQPTFTNGIELGKTITNIVLQNDITGELTVKIYNYDNDLTITDNLSANYTYSLTEEDLDSDGADDDGVLTILTVDPLTDKDIVGIVEAQVEMSHRIIKHTTIPVLHRIEWLRRHKKEDNLTNQNIKFQFSNAMLASLSKAIPVSTNQNIITEKLPNNWFMWSEGNISIGKVGEGLSSSAKEIDTNGITIGADNRVNEDKIYGAALRLGKDSVDVGSSGTSLDTDAYSLSLYGTVAKNDTNFVDGILGISRLKTNHIRKKNSNTLAGERHGKQVFGTINFSKIYNKNDFNFNPTGRIDLGYTELDDYNETGVDPLTYDKHEITTGIASVGMILDDISKLKSTTLKRNVRLEYNVDFSPSSDATLSYVADPATDYTLTVGNEATHNLRAGIGFDLSTDNGFSVIANYERNQGKESGHSDKLYFALGYVPNTKTKYALNLNGGDSIATGFNIVKNIRGFDLKFNFESDILSESTNQNANISLNKVF